MDLEVYDNTEQVSSEWKTLICEILTLRVIISSYPQILKCQSL